MLYSTMLFSIGDLLPNETLCATLFQIFFFFLFTSLASLLSTLEIWDSGSNNKPQKIPRFQLQICIHLHPRPWLIRFKTMAIMISNFGSFSSHKSYSIQTNPFFFLNTLIRGFVLEQYEVRFPSSISSYIP